MVMAERSLPREFCKTPQHAHTASVQQKKLVANVSLPAFGY